MNTNSLFNKIQYVLFLCLIFIILANTFSDKYENYSFLLCIFCLLEFIASFVNKNFVFTKYMAFLATMQWLISPIYLSYYDEINFHIIYIPKAEYLEYAVPAVLFFVVGLRFFSNKIDLLPLVKKAQDQIKLRSNVGPTLFIIGLLANYINTFSLPEIFNFWVGYFSFLIYVGFCYCIFDFDIKRRYVIYIMFVVMVVITLKATLFYYLIFTGITLFTLYVKFKEYSLFKVSIFMVVGMQLILVIQFLKMDARAILWNDSNDSSAIDVFYSVGKEKFSSNNSSDVILVSFFRRLNMGQYSSLVMSEIKQRATFLDGETYINGLLGSIVPRLIWPDKPKAGGGEIMLRLANYDTGKNSLNISHLGEAYGNFGFTGGIICMFFIGSIISFTIKMYIFYIKRVPTLIFWTPIFFTDILRCEIDFGQMINGIMKCAAFIYIVFYLSSKLFRTKL